MANWLNLTMEISSRDCHHEFIYAFFTLTLQLILIEHCKHGEYCELILSIFSSSSCLWCDRTCQSDTYGCWESGHGCPKYGDVRSVQIEPHLFLTSLDNLPKEESQLCHYLVVNFPCLQVESCYSKRSTRQVSSIHLHPRTLSSSLSRSISFFLSIFLVLFLSVSRSLSFYLFSIHLFTLSTVGMTAFISSFFSNSFFSLSILLQMNELVHCVMCVVYRTGKT